MILLWKMFPSILFSRMCMMAFRNILNRFRSDLNIALRNISALLTVFMLENQTMQRLEHSSQSIYWMKCKITVVSWDDFFKSLGLCISIKAYRVTGIHISVLSHTFLPVAFQAASLDRTSKSSKLNFCMVNLSHGLGWQGWHTAIITLYYCL